MSSGLSVPGWATLGVHTGTLNNFLLTNNAPSLGFVNAPVGRWILYAEVDDPPAGNPWVLAEQGDLYPGGVAAAPALGAGITVLSWMVKVNWFVNGIQWNLTFN